MNFFLFLLIKFDDNETGGDYTGIVDPECHGGLWTLDTLSAMVPAARGYRHLLLQTMLPSGMARIRRHCLAAQQQRKKQKERKEMFEKSKKDRRAAALQKEWKLVTAQENRMLLEAHRKAEQRKKENSRSETSGKEDNPANNWKAVLEQKIPPKVYDNLRAAFGKAFSLIFEKGEVIIEKTYNKDNILKDFAIRDYAVEVKGSRKELKEVRKKSGAADFANMTLSTVEGIGLGALGIGLPDIVIFIGILLKGIYEAALNYGYDYDKPEEKLLMLKMMETALLEGEDWLKANAEVDGWIQNGVPQVPLDIREQIRKTADVFALDMLLLKFIQGVPIVGIVGGATNPIYYKKIMKYVRMKYQKRYLLDKMSGAHADKKPQ